MRTVVACLFLAVAVAPGPTAAQPGRVGILTALDGQATVVRAGQSPVALKFKDSVFPGDRIKTAQASLLKILLGDRALLTAGELSELTITAESAKTVTALDNGKVAVAVAVIKTRLMPGKSFEVRTPNAVVQVGGSMVVVEVQSGTTDVDCVDGNIFVATAGTPSVWCPPGQGLTITGSILGPRVIRPNVMSSLRSTTRSSASRQPPVPPFGPGSSAAVILPSVWTLLIDRGKGFEPWVGTHSEGYVAGDATSWNVTLAACGAIAKILVEKDGAPVVCAHLPDREESLQYRSPQGRVMAKGPLAGRLVVFASVSEAADWTLRSMWIDRKGFLLLGGDYWNLGLAACEAAAQWNAERGQWVACVRSPRVDPDLRDVHGRLMADGPFAGGMIVYDPSQQPQVSIHAPPLFGLPGQKAHAPLLGLENLLTPSTRPPPEVKECPYDDWMSTGCKAGQPLK